MPASTTELLYIPDWAERLQLRLLVPFQKPRILALAGAVGDVVQVHEDEAFDLVASTGLFESSGDGLEQWGEIVGEQPGPLTDNEYRQFILARMVCNLCFSTTPELLAIFDIITEDNVGVFHESNFPAAFYLLALRRDFMSDAKRRRVARMMEDVRPATRSMSMVEAVVGGFGWEGADFEISGWDDGPFATTIEPE